MTNKTKQKTVETLADIGGLQWATMAVVSNFTNDVSDSVNSLAPLHWKVFILFYFYFILFYFIFFCVFFVLFCFLFCVFFFVF